MATQTNSQKKWKWHRLRKKIAPYIYISPFYILFVLFMAYPLVFSFYLSFHKWNGMTRMIPVGLDNYRFLLQDEIFIQSLLNSVILFVMYVPPLLLGALILAVILNSAKLRGKAFFRSAVFIPYVTSIVAVGFTFALMLDRDYGLINLILCWFGISPIRWLQTPWLARTSLSGLMIWRWLGYNMIIFLAGLQNIDPDYYEAARIDGANTVQLFTKITLPLMRPIIFFCTLLSTIGTFSLFTEPFLLTNGGPFHSTTTPVMHLYSNSFNYLNFGYGSSIAYVYFVILFILTIIERQIIGKEQN